MCIYRPFGTLTHWLFKLLSYLSTIEYTHVLMSGFHDWLLHSQKLRLLLGLCLMGGIYVHWSTHNLIEVYWSVSFDPCGMKYYMYRTLVYLCSTYITVLTSTCILDSIIHANMNCKLFQRFQANNHHMFTWFWKINQIVTFIWYVEKYQLQILKPL